MALRSIKPPNDDKKSDRLYGAIGHFGALREHLPKIVKNQRGFGALRGQQNLLDFGNR